MDLKSIITTITTNAAQYVVRGASDYIPDDLSSVIHHAYSYFPAEVNLVEAAQFALYFGVGSLILGIISRVVLGKRSSLNHSLSSSLGIALIYALTVIIYTFRPWRLESFLSPLPFITFSGEYLIILPIADAHFSALCQQVLSLIILSFLVNILDSLIPEGDSVLGWYLLRFITVIFAMVLHLAASSLLNAYLPGFIITYAPEVLLILLGLMLFSGFISLILGMVISVTNPFLGAMYSFFFSNLVGKQLSKAVFSSAILCGIFFLLEYCGYTIISISAAALMAYIPLAIILLVLWYLIGHLL